MNKNMVTKRKYAAIAVTVFAIVCLVWVFAALSLQKGREAREAGEGRGLSEVFGWARAGEQQTNQRSAWLVDWRWQDGLSDFKKLTGAGAGDDVRVEAEDVRPEDRARTDVHTNTHINAHSHTLTSLQVFALYFDEIDQLMFTDEMNTALPHIVEAVRQHPDIALYVSLVNDQVHGDGTVSQKDADLITRLMATEESRTNHIEAIIDLVEQYTFDGIEIDYERIAEQDWENLIAFYTQLDERLHSMGKSLRIVLEPRAPIEAIALPEGPTYVMMAYNLFGTHSGPGPKADDNLIKTVTDKMKHLPRARAESDGHYVALATGGFAWAWDDDRDRTCHAEQEAEEVEEVEASGKLTKSEASSSFSRVAQLTENEATALLPLRVAPPQRDAASGSVTFDYVDEDGVRHTIWYADDITLTRWVETARRNGYTNIALWRLGQWSDASLQHLQR